MYQSYWGLKTRPFDDRAAAAFYYPAEGHQTALAKLRYTLEHGGGAAVLAGETGVGKTVLLDALDWQLGGLHHVFLRLAFPLLSPVEILAYLADELADELPPAPHAIAPVDQSLRRIESQLTKLAAQGKRAVVVVDDAHLIEDSRTLEALRLLLNIENVDRPPPALLLAGQTRLLPRLARMPSFAERLSATCVLHALSAEETALYIAHRSQAAGATREIFDQRAIEAVHTLGRGLPRRINRLCDLALVVGYAEERPTIAAAQIEAVAEELLSLAAC